MGLGSGPNCLPIPSAAFYPHFLKTMLDSTFMPCMSFFCLLNSLFLSLHEIASALGVPPDVLE